MKAQSTQNNTKTNEGFSTLEIVLALALITLFISTVIITIFGPQSLTADGELTIEALEIAKSALEEARAEAVSDWDGLNPFTENDTIFTKDLEIGDADEFVKSAVSRISWEIGGKIYKVELPTLFTDWQSASAEGFCAKESTGVWTSPSSMSVSLATTGPATGVDVKDDIAYVTADGDSTQKDFFAIDVATNPPQILWSLDTGPGLMAVKVSGNYAYVANTSVAMASGQLQIIDLTTRAVRSFRIAGSTSGDTANTIFYSHDKVYLGMVTSSVAEFHIIDVSDLNNIHELGNWEFNRKVNAIYVSNGIAYVATPDNEELKMLNVRDPENVSFIAGYDAAGGSGNGKSFGRTGKRLFLGRTLGNEELYVLSIDSISAGPSATANVNSSVNGMAIIGNFVFVGTIDGAKEFQVWKISDSGDTFNLISSLDLVARATSVDCEGQTLYVTTENPAEGLNIISSN